MYNELKKLVDSYVQLNDEDWQLILDSIETVTIKKKEYLIQTGETRDFMVYIQKGIFKSYFLDAKGNETGLQLHMDGTMLYDHSNFAMDKPTTLNIRALENSNILLFDKKARENLMRQQPKFNRFVAGLIRNDYNVLQKRFIATQTLSAEERFDILVRDYPDITQRIPQHQIASFLGISPTFLSLIRKKKSKK